MTICDHLWPDVTICDHLWPDMTICDQIWPSVTSCDQLFLLNCLLPARWTRSRTRAAFAWASPPSRWRSWRSPYSGHTPRCSPESRSPKLQHGITQPILWLFRHLCTIFIGYCDYHLATRTSDIVTIFPIPKANFSTAALLPRDYLLVHLSDIVTILPLPQRSHNIR